MILTAVTTMLGMLPMAVGVNVDFINFAIESGTTSSEMWSPMATAIIFGLAFATMLTLVLVPVMYIAQDKAAARIGSAWRSITRKAPEPEPRAGALKIGVCSMMKQTVMFLALVVTLAAVPGVLLGQEPPVSPGKESAMESGSARTVSIEEALALAARNNPDLMNVDEQLLQAQASYEQAWAMVLPAAGAEYQITWNEEEVAFAMPGMAEEIVVVPDRQDTMSFYATTKLFDASAFATIRQADQGKELTGHSARQARSDLLVGVASAYYQAEAQRKLIEVARLNFENAREFKRLTDARNELGMNTKIDVLRSEQGLLDAEKELEDAKDAFGLALLALAHLVGETNVFDIAEPPRPEMVGVEPDQLVDIALSNREDYRAQREALGLAETGKVVTAAKFLPTVDLTYSYSKSAEAGLSGDESSMVILGAKWSILEGGSRMAQLKIDESNIRVESNNLRALELEISEDVQEALTEVKKSERNVKLAEKQVEIAEESYRSLNRQYEVGLASSLDVIDAFTMLGNARNGLVIERLMLDLSVLNLNRAVGALYDIAEPS